MRTLALVKRWSHHSPSGGYDTLARYLGAAVIHRQENWGLWWRLIRKTIERPWRSPADGMGIDYRYEDLQVERLALWYTAFGRFPVTHCFYEDQLNLLLRRRQLLNSRLVATFHLPWHRSHRYFDQFRGSLVRALDGVIAVSTDLADELSELLGERRVSYIPHGIDTEAFFPGKPTDTLAELQLLTVGSFYRDFELIHRLADECRWRKLPVSFRYVGPRQEWAAYTGCSNVKCESELDEPALVEAYQTAHALLLPVTSATANNSLLESLACGLPVISTKVGGIPDYLDSASGWLLPPRELEPLLELVKQLAADPKICGQKRLAARAKAETFAWPKVAARISEFYTRVLAGDV